MGISDDSILVSSLGVRSYDFARQPRISAPNPFAPRAFVLRTNQIKNGRGILVGVCLFRFFMPI